MGKDKKRGFFRRLVGGKQTEGEETPPQTADAELSEAEEAEQATLETEAAVAQDAPLDAEEPEIASQPEQAPQAAEKPGPDAEQPDAPAQEGYEEPFFLDEDQAQAPEAESEDKPKKKGFFSRLRSRLGKTRSGLVDKVRQAISFYGKVDEELIEEIEMILVQADVGIETTTRIVDDMRRRSEAKRADSAEALLECFKEAMADIVGYAEHRLELREKPPTVILVVGVNGVGKTTTIGKLAKQYTDAGKKVMMVAGDTFRAAAVEQLAIWAERTNSEIVKQEMGADPASVCYDALSAAQSRDFDVVLIDTAGRLHTKSNLMEELKKVRRVIQKVMPEAPHETLLVLDATTGQNALSQADLFCQAVDVTGFVMTKLDGTAKGGILIALRDKHEVPVVKIGIGEGEEDLRDFDAQAFVEALFAT